MECACIGHESGKRIHLVMHTHLIGCASKQPVPLSRSLYSRGRPRRRPSKSACSTSRRSPLGILLILDYNQGIVLTVDLQYRDC